MAKSASEMGYDIAILGGDVKNPFEVTSAAWFDWRTGFLLGLRARSLRLLASIAECKARHGFEP
jgi:hypothetical protein